MARQPYFVNSTEKQMEVFNAFDGGMNTQEHSSKLNDNEFSMLENVDVIAGGVITNRGGYQRVSDSPYPIEGISQGIFFYDNLGEGKIIEAIGGCLYIVHGDSYAKMLIENMMDGFQTTRPIEAVQVRDKMYFATGSGLVVYDGLLGSLVTAYKPTGLEALYIGKNGYAADPDNYLADITDGVSNQILGLMSDQRYGIVNKKVTFTAYVEKIISDTLEYQFSSKYATELKYKVWQPWGASKQYIHAFGKNTDYMIKCEIRKKDTTAVLGEYILPKFRVATTPDAKPEPIINYEDMKTCNRILLHYDRLVLYGDTNNPDHMYTSHLNNFSYFPRTNIMRITDPIRGSLHSVVQYKNFLVCFTTNAIFMITGASPMEYVKSPVHTTIGSNHPYTIQVMKNYIVFISRDNNVYIIKSFNFSTTDKLNVERIDLDIRDQIAKDLNDTNQRVIGTIYNDQYYIYIRTGTSCKIYRFYYELGIWVRDSVVNKFSTMKVLNGKLYLTTDVNGQVYQLNKDVFADDVNTQFDMTITSKNYDYGMSYHKKKLKQFQLLSKVQSDTVIMVRLIGDDVNELMNVPVVPDPTRNDATSQKFVVSANGRFRYVKVTLTIQVKSEIQLLGFGFVFKYSSPK